MPTSPNSLTMTASRRPRAWASTWRISVVLPAPRKPVTMVQGTRASDAVIPGSPANVERRGARDEAALERVGPTAPRHQPVRATGRTACAPSTRRGAAACGVEMAEHIGPGAVATHSGAQAAIAIGETAHLPHGNAGAGGRARRRLGEHRARNRDEVERASAAAGDADEDRDRVLRRDRRLWRRHLGCGVGPASPVRSLRAGALAPGARSTLSRCRSTSAAANACRRGTPPGCVANRRQVSWLAGRRPSPPSRVDPVAAWQGLAAYSCGGSCGMGTDPVPHRIPCWLSCERPSIAAS